MEQRPPLNFGVVAIEKSAFGSPSTKVANFTTFFCIKNTLFTRIIITIIIIIISIIISRSSYY